MSQNAQHLPLLGAQAVKGIVNASFGQDWTTSRVRPQVDADFRWANGVFAHLLDEPGLRADLDARWTDLGTGPFGQDWLEAQKAIAREMSANLTPATYRSSATAHDVESPGRRFEVK